MNFVEEVKLGIADMPKQKADELAAELRAEREANEADGRCACGNRCSLRDRMFHESMSLFVELTARTKA
jgi:hypothetical protein